jgi:cytoskeleton protein RodZ
VRVADAAPAAAPANAPDANSAPREAAPDASPAPARVTRLTLELSGESWVEVYDSRGERLYYDVASAGSVQSIEGRGPLRVVLGNAAGVSVQVDGQQREIPANALNGEGARFVVNRSGSLSRARP